MEKRRSRAQIAKLLVQAKATSAVEGMFLTPENEQLVSAYLSGEISKREFVKRALEIAHLA